MALVVVHCSDFLLGVARPRKPAYVFGVTTLGRAVVLSPARTPLVVLRIEVPLVEIGRPGRRCEGDDVALPHGEGLVEGEELLPAQDPAELLGRALAKELVLPLLLVLQHGDAAGGLLPELLVSEEVAEGVPLWVLLRVRALPEIDRPGDQLAVLRDAEGLLLAVGHGHERGDPSNDLAALRARGSRRVLGVPDDLRSRGARRRYGDRRRDECRAECDERQRVRRAAPGVRGTCPRIAHRPCETPAAPPGCGHRPSTSPEPRRPHSLRATAAPVGRSGPSGRAS